MKRLALLDVVGLTRGLLAGMPHLQKFAGKNIHSIRPMLPAVTCPVQATYLTGRLPAEHGIVGNGWYDRALGEVHFWKQSNRLVSAPKIWETIRRSRPGFTCANLFWWYNMHSSVDWAVTPRPIYRSDGLKLFDIDSTPRTLRDEMKRELGEFPFPAFWGPAAGIASSQWIAAAARWIEERHRPDLHLVYLPHLDYNLQRFGPEDPRIRSDLHLIDTVAGELIEFLQARDVQVLVLSEYGITRVNRPVFLNRIFRKAGWLSFREELGTEVLDPGGCRALAVADHQVAHIYVNDPRITADVRSAVSAEPGVEAVYGELELRDLGLFGPRCGDLLAIAEPESWFAYYHWLDDAKAPDFARSVDIHRKPGYDPVELFLDPAIRFPKLRIARILAARKLGFRTRFDVIPLDPQLIRGSHGAIPRQEADWPVVLGARGLPSGPLQASDIHSLLLGCCLPNLHTASGSALPVLGAV